MKKKSINKYMIILFAVIFRCYGICACQENRKNFY